MAYTPKTAAARHVMLGTDDQSTRLVTPEAKAVAQHVPLFYMNTQKGDYNRRHIVNSEFSSLFGIDSLVPTSKYFNFMSVFPKEILPYTSAVIQRSKGKVWDSVNSEYVDASTASLIIYMASTTVPVTEKTYVRDVTTGAVVRDSVGTPTYTVDDVDVTYTGLVVKRTPNALVGTTFTESINGVDVLLTPIKTLRAEGHGEYYNNIGFNIAPFIGDAKNDDIIDNHKTVTYGFTLYNKYLGSPKVSKTVNIEDTIEFTLNPKATVSITNQDLHLDKRVPSEYGNYTDPILPLQSYTLDVSKSLVTSSLVKTGLYNKLESILDAEINFTGISAGALTLASWVDYGLLNEATTAEATRIAKEYKHMLNFVTCINTGGVEYETVRPFPSSFFGASADYTFVPVTDGAVTYLAGGEDSDETFNGDMEAIEAGLIEEVARYEDKNDRVQSIALNRDTILYDPGITMASKIKMGAYISLKTNTMLAMSTTISGEEPVSISTHISRAEAIKGILKLNTESAVYNTPTARVFTVMGDGLLANGSYGERVPMLLDYGTKLARYTGALNGEWNSVYNYYAQSGNIVDRLVECEPSFIPDTIKDKLQVAGLIWIDNEDTLQFFYPSNQTIYENDTSVLNSVVTMVAITTLNTINDAIWRKYSGTKNLSNLELKVAVEDDVRERTANLFDSNFVISPDVYFLERDELLGWIWRLRVTIYANVDKTVMVSHIIARRLSDLE